MNLVRWSPFRELDEVFAQGLLGEEKRLNNWLPAADVRESGDAYRIDVEMAAVSPDDVKVTFNDGVLAISGERRFEAENENESVRRSERRFGNFARSFRLPEDADEDAIEAKVDRGLVVVTVPKREKAKQRSIEVKVH